MGASGRRAAELHPHELRAHSADIVAECKLFVWAYDRDPLRLEARVPAIRRTAIGNRV
jgi:hypothetical protein